MYLEKYFDCLSKCVYKIVFTQKSITYKISVDMKKKNSLTF